MKKRTIITISLILIGLGLIVFFIWPTYQVWRAESSFLQEIRLKNSQMEEAVALIKAFDKNDAFEEFQRLEQALPIESKEEELIVTLETIAGNNGLVVNSLEFQPIKETKAAIFSEELDSDSSQESLSQKKELQRVKIGLSLIGNFSSLKRFLADCEKNIRILNFNNVEFLGSPFETEAASDVFKYGLEIETNYIPD